MPRKRPIFRTCTTESSIAIPRRFQDLLWITNCRRKEEKIRLGMWRQKGSETQKSWIKLCCLLKSNLRCPFLLGQNSSRRRIFHMVESCFRVRSCGSCLFGPGGVEFFWQTRLSCFPVTDVSDLQARAKMSGSSVLVGRWGAGHIWNRKPASLSAPWALNLGQKGH